MNSKLTLDAEKLLNWKLIDRVTRNKEMNRKANDFMEASLASKDMEGTPKDSSTIKRLNGSVLT
jgi:hypothetical protein